jgi:hypothetical protein
MTGSLFMFGFLAKNGSLSIPGFLWPIGSLPSRYLFMRMP